MGSALSTNQFPVAGQTIVVTGGSQGMGLEVARQLAEKGANVVLVARTLEKLQIGLKYVTEGAPNPETQRFHCVSADLTSAPECVRVIDEVEAWNGSPPDIVWCCAGTSEPTLFVETSAELLESQMKSNYFSSAFMAHAVMQRWLQPLEKSASAGKDTAPDRHLIFTSSVVAFFTFIGYTPYSPAKAALRSLSDTLSQEMNLYQAAHPNGRRVRLHTIFPGTILSEGYEQENLVKPDITKSLEEFDKKRTPTVIAKRSIAGLESGLELITTDLLADFARRGMLGSSSRAGFLRGLVDTLLASLMCVMILVSRMDMDSKTRAWGRKHGTAGRKKAEDSSPA